MESGTKWTDSFVITIGISSVFSKFTEPRSPPADHMSRGLLRLFVDARINHGTERILCHKQCRYLLR